MPTSAAASPIWGFRPPGSAPTNPNNPWATFAAARSGAPLVNPFAARVPPPEPPPFSVPDYAQSLRPALAAGLSSIPLGATLQDELARQIALRGPLDPALADAAARVPALQDINDAFTLADSLASIRNDINITTASGTSAVPQAPSTLSGVLGGAASGAATGGAIGGPYGAAIGAGIGALGGLLGSSGARSAARTTRNRIASRGAHALATTEPGAVGGTLAGLAPSQRELALSGGYGQQQAQALEEAISRSGLRDSALGTLGGLAAAAAPEQLARAQALSQTLATTRRNVETIMGQPVRPGTDRLTQALGAVTEGFLTYKSLFPATPKATSASTSSSPLTPLPEPPYTPVDEPIYTPAGGWQG